MRGLHLKAETFKTRVTKLGNLYIKPNQEQRKMQL